jgi:hypothetical protein
MNDNIDDSSDFCLLFCDKTLIKIISPVPAELERYPYQGTTATRIKSWDIEDTKRVVNAINAPALTHAQIIDDLQPYNGKSMSLNVLPAFLLTGYFEKMTPRIRKDYATNQEFLQHYDGCRANLGMSAGQVETIFGKPLRIFPTINGQIVRIFGNNIDLQVNSAYLFSCVAVVFDRQERVLAIYSQDFFNDDWKK